MLKTAFIPSIGGPTAVADYLPRVAERIPLLRLEVGAGSSMETRMERLVFTCPKTGKKVDVGIESELQTLLRIRANKVVVARCPCCAQRHEWLVRDAELAHAA